jgi:hypothetical protein
MSAVLLKVIKLVCQTVVERQIPELKALKDVFCL